MSSSDARSNAPAYLGLGSVLAVALCTLWLALVGHLDLYINPRYSVFTVVLAAVGVPASIAGLVVIARGHGHTHGDDADEHDARARATMATGSARAGSAVVAPSASRSAVQPPSSRSASPSRCSSCPRRRCPPAPHSSGASTRRPCRTPPAPRPRCPLLGSEGVDTSEYGVKDWAALIRQTTDTTALVGKQVELTGFVVPGDDGSFTLTRFVISCCAVDAQPVGLGVVTGDGTGTVPDEGQWVTVRGALAANPDQSADARIVVKAAKVTEVAQPEDPYEY